MVCLRNDSIFSFWRRWERVGLTGGGSVDVDAIVPGGGVGCGVAEVRFDPIRRGESLRYFSVDAVAIAHVSHERKRRCERDVRAPASSPELSESMI